MTLAEQVDTTIAQFMDAPEPAWLSPAALRLARRVPSLPTALRPFLTDPLDHALVGLEAPPEFDEAAPLRDRILRGVALADGEVSLPVAEAAALEAEAKGDDRWWVDAARLHVLASEERERSARMALSYQDLPYVFPGELHPMMVEVLAVGDRVLTALHVDWMRKLAGWVMDVAVLDVRLMGLWFWPQLRYLDERKVARPLKKLLRVRRGQPGSRGLVVAYRARIGQDVSNDLAALEGADRFVAALALMSDRPHL
jgi:hypothetical protein